MGFRENNDDLLLHSCCGFSTITVTSQQQRAATLNPVNAARCWSRDAEPGAPQPALEEGEAKGKEG